MSKKNADTFLSDQFLSQLLDPNYDCAEYVSTTISRTNLEDLVDLYFSLIEKNKSIDEYLSNFALQNEDFLRKQFSIPGKYGVS